MFIQKEQMATQNSDFLLQMSRSLISKLYKSKNYLIKELSSQEISCKTLDILPSIFLTAHITNQVCNI